MAASTPHPFLRLRISVWGVLTAAGFLAGLGTLAGFFGRYAWWLDLGSHFRPQYTALFAALALGCAAARRWPAAGGALALALLNGALLLPFLPLRPSLPPAPGGLRVMLINVNTERGRPDLVQAAVEREQPDVLVLEEISARWLVALAGLATGFPHRVQDAREDNFGIALWSRRPWSEARVIALGDAGVPSIRATLPLRGTSVCVLATHPLPPGGPAYSRYRNGQLAEIADFVCARPEPVLVVGDLNVTPWSPYFRDLLRATGLHNSSTGRGLHGSWPAWFPLSRIPIDHVLHDPRLAVRDKRVGDYVASDHLPVVVDLDLAM